MEFRLPDLGEGVTETEIVRWLVAADDQVDEDQPMVEVMTDKATVEIPAPAAGRIARLVVAEGQVVPVGTVIVEIEADDAALASSNRPVNAPGSRGAAADSARRGAAAGGTRDGARPGSRGGGRRVQATPLVRRLAASLGVELAAVEGSGTGGRITEDDVRAAAAAMPGAAVAAAGSAGAAGGQGVDPSLRDGARVVALRGMRRAIGEHLSRAQQVPTVTVVEEADLTALDAARDGGSYLPWLVRAVLRGFAEVPELNAVLDEQAQELLVHERVDMGIAVQAPDGLVVPVLRDCGDLSLEQLGDGIARIAERATAGELAPGELRGSTFTITSAGRFGGLFTTPLLNVPEVGILGLHRAADRPAVVDGRIEVRRMANLSITFDHRALDGIAASRFLLETIAALESPESLR